MNKMLALLAAVLGVAFVAPAFANPAPEAPASSKEMKKEKGKNEAKKEEGKEASPAAGEAPKEAPKY